MRLVIDVKTGQPTDEQETPSLRGFIGWSRLAEELRRTGNVKDGETLTHLIITDRGLELAYKIGGSR